MSGAAGVLVAGLLAASAVVGLDDGSVHSAAHVHAALPAAAAPLIQVVRYVPPTALHVLRPFAPPLTRYGRGHLGVDLAAAAGTRVVSAGDGVVTFAGTVAGRGVVVVAHPDGVRTEYEPVSPTVRRGDPVRGGQVVATLRGMHRGCRQSCLHWGARRGERYLDPLSLLRRLGPVRLLPWSTGPPG